jgi:predicted ABC-type ATPase
MPRGPARAALRPWLDARPVLVAIAGPNGAGKTTFYRAHVEPAGLRFVNADVLSLDLTIDPYEAARIAQEVRGTLVASRESFAFETVLSDPAGEKVAFLQRATAGGYAVVLCFIGISGPEVSEQRVAMRVSQGGHDVPSAKLSSRFPRTMANLARAVAALPHVLVFDNDDLAVPFRFVAEFEAGRVVGAVEPLPQWLGSLAGS